MRIIQILAAVVLIALAGAVGWHQYQLANPQTIPMPAVTLSPVEGEPDFDLQDISTASLVSVFSADCIECRSEMPLLLALQAEGVALYGIATGTGADDALVFLDDTGNPFVGLMLADRPAITAAFGETSLPLTLVLSNEGAILTMIEGAIDVSVLRNQIYPLLDRQARRVD